MIVISISNQLKQEFDALIQLFETYLMQYSQIQYADDGVIFVTSGNHRWISLSGYGRQMQSQIFNKYEKLSELVSVILSNQPPEIIRDYGQNHANVLSVIEQNSRTYMKSTNQAFMEVKTSLINILKLIDNTYDSTADSAIFVADTNALITNSSIELWRFEGYSNFEILILPTVLSELEQMKVNHRNPEVREKVISIVRRIKSFRERGKLSEGVVLAKGVSKLRTIAKEPSFENSLSWLDSQNNDDRIIASFVEVIKEHPRSSVILVTDDLNVQNKCEFAGLPYVEVPVK